MQEPPAPLTRKILDGVLTTQDCDSLLHIARVYSAPGYRDFCCAVTLSTLAALHPPSCLPLVKARQKVHAAVETALGREMQLFIEFSGLISWRPGACIGWHRDDNRSYLSQRHAAAVTYLNDIHDDFHGGTFEFRRSSPSNAPPTMTAMDSKPRFSGAKLDQAHENRVWDIEDVMPQRGRCVAYLTTEEHRVSSPITSGERFTLAMWFTTDMAHDEDSKVLRILSHSDSVPTSLHALPDGTDLRLCRLAMNGVGIATRDDSRSWKVLRSLVQAEHFAEIEIHIQRDVCVVLLQETDEQHAAASVLMSRSFCASIDEALDGLQRWLAKQKVVKGNSPGEESVCGMHLCGVDRCGRDAEDCVTACAWLALPFRECHGDGLAHEVVDCVEATKLLRREEAEMWENLVHEARKLSSLLCLSV